MGEDLGDHLLFFYDGNHKHLPLARRARQGIDFMINFMKCGTPMFLSVFSLNQFKAIGGSDGLAPIRRPGYGRLAIPSNFDSGHGRRMRRSWMAQWHIRLLA